MTGLDRDSLALLYLVDILSLKCSTKARHQQFLPVTAMLILVNNLPLNYMYGQCFFFFAKSTTDLVRNFHRNNSNFCENRKSFQNVMAANLIFSHNCPTCVRFSRQYFFTFRNIFSFPQKFTRKSSLF
jgi:hypothetical protein